MNQLLKIIFILCYFSISIFAITDLKSVEIINFLQVESVPQDNFLEIEILEDSIAKKLSPFLIKKDSCYYSAYFPVYSLFNYPIYSVCGKNGVIVVSMIFLAFTLLILYYYLHKLKFSNKLILISLIVWGISSGMFYYSTYFGGELAGLFFALCAFILTDIQLKNLVKKTQLKLLISGILYGLSFLMCEEFIFFYVGIYFYYLYYLNFVKNPKCMCYYVLPVFGFLFCISFWLITNFVFMEYFFGNRAIEMSLISKNAINLSFNEVFNSIASGLIFLIISIVIFVFNKKKIKTNLAFLIFFLTYILAILFVIKGLEIPSIKASKFLGMTPMFLFFVLHNIDIFKGLKKV